MSAAGLAGKVRGEFERAVQLNPKDLEARLDLTEFYIEAPGIVGGGEDKARQQALSVATVNPAREHWVYARIAEKKDSAAAEHEYRQYIELSNGDAEAWLNLALFLRRQKRYDEMEQAIVKLSQAPMPKLDVLVEAAQILYRSGRRFPSAIELLNRYIAAGPVEAAPAFKAHYLLGMLLEKQGDKAGAAARVPCFPILGTKLRPGAASTQPSCSLILEDCFKSYCPTRAWRTTICLTAKLPFGAFVEIKLRMMVLSSDDSDCQSVRTLICARPSFSRFCICPFRLRS